jgi:hypothetical protein
MPTIAQRLADDEDIGFNINKTYGTPSKILDNLMQVESSGNEYAINKDTKAMGPYQFMPDTIAEMHKKGVKFNAFDKKEARAAADYYLNDLAQQNGGDYRKALAAYGGFKSADPTAYVNKVIGSEIQPVRASNQSVASRLLSEQEPTTEEEQPSTEPAPFTAGRVAGLLARGAAPSVVGAVAGAPLGPVGSLVGTMALPIGNVLNTGINAATQGVNKLAGTNIPQLGMPSQVVSQYMTQAGLPEAQNRGERVLEAVGGAMGGVGSQVPAFAKLAEQATNPILKSFAKSMAEQPLKQAGIAAPAATVGQIVTEMTGLPFVGQLAAMGTGGAAGVRLGKKAINVPSAEELAANTANLYAKAKNSGIQFDSNKFSGAMKNIESDLEQHGYLPPAPGETDPYPKISLALRSLKNPDTPKDFTKLTNLRKLIQNAQASTDLTEKMLATNLKDDFDHYVMNAPQDHVISSSKEGSELWKDARKSYSKLKKAEIFDDMINRAELEKSQYTQGGTELSMAKQLRNLAKNEKKMRMFTPEEQDAIRKEALGGSAQSVARFVGKFAPVGPVTAILSSQAIKQAPLLGSALSAGSVGAREISNALRKGGVNYLADMMRLGKAPELEPRLSKLPVTSLRGLLSTVNAPEEQ